MTFLKARFLESTSMPVLVRRLPPMTIASYRAILERASNALGLVHNHVESIR